MGAPDLLLQLRGSGFALTLTADGGVKVTPASALTDDHRHAIRAHRGELVALLEGGERRSTATADSPRPFRLPKADADRCHWPPWSKAEIQTFVARVALFMRRSVSATDADDLAEALTLRDRDGDDRRMCAECQHGRSRRCPNGTPLPDDLLHRCSDFTDAIYRPANCSTPLKDDPHP